MNTDTLERPLRHARLFDHKNLNKWIAEARRRPVPRKLFGDFWLEGELSILFSDTGKGKSVLAVQIAESIARGRPIGFASEPLDAGDAAVFAITAKPQKVLYFDFELSDKQFEMRYAEERLDENTDFLTGHYVFADNFDRAEIEPFAELPKGFDTFDQFMIAELRRSVVETNATAVIIDNLTFLRNGTERVNDAAALMRSLRRLKKELGISVLVLAHTPKRHRSQPLNVNDLQGSKALANFADNIFAIGQSHLDTSVRYIKHIKPRSTEMIYDETHVPTFTISKDGGNFLSFRFEGFAHERRHLADFCTHFRMEKAAIAKDLSSQGLSQRAIAAKLNTSLGTVNRYLHMEPYEDCREPQSAAKRPRRRLPHEILAEMYPAPDETVPDEGQYGWLRSNLGIYTEKLHEYRAKAAAKPTADNLRYLADYERYLEDHRKLLAKMFPEQVPKVGEIDDANVQIEVENAAGVDLVETADAPVVSAQPSRLDVMRERLAKKEKVLEDLKAKGIGMEKNIYRRAHRDHSQLKHEISELEQKDASGDATRCP